MMSELWIEENALVTHVNADLKKALEVTTNKSETQYNIAKLIYSYIISLGDKKPYGDWSYDKALSIIHDAMQADNQPIYTQLEGDILFAMKKYPEAYAAYEKVNQSSIASAATFYSRKTKQYRDSSRRSA